MSGLPLPVSRGGHLADSMPEAEKPRTPDAEAPAELGRRIHLTTKPLKTPKKPLTPPKNL